MVQTTRLSGINPLAYMGVNPYTPAPLFIYGRRPTVNDFQNFLIGTLWILSNDSDPKEIWMLVALTAGSATWVQIYPAGGGSGGASEFPCDTGTANEVGGVVNVFGGTDISTSGSGNTITISLSSEIPDTFTTDAGTAHPIAKTLQILGGSNIQTSGSGNTVTVATIPDIFVPATLEVGSTTTLDSTLSTAGNATFHSSVTISPFSDGVVQSNNSGTLFSNKGTNGQVLIGSNSGAPAWANITSGDGSVTIVNGSNSIDLSSAGGGSGSGSFLAVQQSTIMISTGSGSGNITYSMGAGEALSILFDASSALYAGDGAGSAATFTAPQTGYYAMTFCAAMTGPQSINTWIYMATPSNVIVQRDSGVGTNNTGTISLTRTMMLSAADVVTFVIYLPSTNITNLLGFNGSIANGPIGYYSYISGYRIA